MHNGSSNIFQLTSLFHSDLTFYRRVILSQTSDSEMLPTVGLHVRGKNVVKMERINKGSDL